MDAIKYFKESFRMCKTISACEKCPLYEYNNVLFPCNCSINNDIDNIFDEKNQKNVVEIVEKWSKEHPAKTRQSEFLKMFPNTSLRDDNIIDICPLSIDKRFKTDKECTNSACMECMKNFWLAEVE